MSQKEAMLKYRCCVQKTVTTMQSRQNSDINV